MNILSCFVLVPLCSTKFEEKMSSDANFVPTIRVQPGTFTEFHSNSSENILIM